MASFRCIRAKIAEDIAAYLVQSEQIPSVVALGVLADPEGVRASGGILAQVLPGADEKAVAMLEERALAMPPVTTLIDQGADAHALLHALAGPLPNSARIAAWTFGSRACARKKKSRPLCLPSGGDELRRLAAEQNETEATCEFCKRVYVFTLDEILALAGTAEGGSATEDR